MESCTVNWTYALPAQPFDQAKYYMPNVELHFVPGLPLLWCFLLNNEKHTAGFSRGAIGTILNESGCKLCLYQFEALQH